MRLQVRAQAPRPHQCILLVAGIRAFPPHALQGAGRACGQSSRLWAGAPEDPPAPHAAPTLQAAEAFDPREGRWQPLPPAPLARSSFGIAALHDCVYAVGGNVGTENLNDVRGRAGPCVFVC